MILTTNIFLVNQFQAAVCCCGDPRPYSSIPVFFRKKEKSKGFISLQGKKIFLLSNSYQILRIYAASKDGPRLTIVTESFTR